MLTLREIAYARSGDKGNSNNISVIPKTKDNIAVVKKNLSESKIKEALYGYDIASLEVKYYEYLELFNILIVGALNGGVSENFNLDRHGKSFSDLILDIVIEE